MGNAEVFFRASGVDMYERLGNGYCWVELGCGTDAHELDHRPDLIRYVGERVGKRGAIGIDSDPNITDVYTHVQYYIDIDFELEQVIPPESGEPLVVSSHNFIDTNPDPDFARGPSFQLIRSRVSTQAENGLVDGGLYVNGTDYYRKHRGSLVRLDLSRGMYEALAVFDGL